MSKNDAFAAIEHGNDDTSQPKVDLCFGGRRAFCKEKYADLGKFKSLKIKPFLAEIGLKLFWNLTTIWHKFKYNWTEIEFQY